MDSFPPPRLADRAVSTLSANDAKHFGVENKYKTLPVHRDNTQAPPANWPTWDSVESYSEEKAKKIKAKMRGGGNSGRGDNPHNNVDLNELRAKIRGMSSMDNDEAPPYGMERPKL